MTDNKKVCGLCGATDNLTKTFCCNNWICDDSHKYIVFSYAANSCYRNHDRYTLCAYHNHANHPGNWKDCDKCKGEFDLPNYVDYGTNDANFEKLQNPPKVKIKCKNCGFESNTVQDFAIQNSDGWYCNKVKCQKEAWKICTKIFRK